MEQFLGEPVPYWIELNRRFSELNPGDWLRCRELLKEVIELQGKVAFYESRIREMASSLPSLA